MQRRKREATIKARQARRVESQALLRLRVHTAGSHGVRGPPRPRLYGHSERCSKDSFRPRTDHAVFGGADIDLHTVTKSQLVEGLARHGLSFDRHLRYMDEPVLPWHTLNHVHITAEEQLATSPYERESTRG